MYDVIVIGGGAAGMLASGVAAEHGARVLLLERNEITGKKLRITGKGRCNLTNNTTVGGVIENVPTGGQFLHGVLNGFPPADTMSFFEALGVPLVTERGERVFPRSGKASDVADALFRYAGRTGVTVMRGRAADLLSRGGAIYGVRAGNDTINCKSAVLATGGASYPATGSTGDGYKMAGGLGHRITPIRGSLAPLNAEPHICGRMQGLTLKNVRLSVYGGGRKPVYEDLGELLFTHFGISGPLTLSASAHMRDFGSTGYSVSIDLKPGLSEAKLDARILRDFSKYSNKNFANALGDLLSKSIIPVIIEKSGIPPDAKVHSIGRGQRMELVKLLKAFRVDIDSPRPVDEAIITSGGVDLLEIDPKTMGSKLVKGLYFAGEVIDADAYTGGFNLQIAWSTAYAAGRCAAEYSAKMQ